MKFIKYIKSSVLFAVIASVCSLMTACSEDLDVNPGIYGDSEGVLNIQFMVPDLDYIKTRSLDSEAERKVYNMSLLLCSDDNTLWKRIDLSDATLENLNNGFETTRSYTYQVPIEKENQSKVKCIYAVANTQLGDGTDLLENFTEGRIDFSTIKSSDCRDKNGGFLMSGVMKAEDGNKKVLNLTRTAAKITLKDASGDITLKGWKLYNVASEALLMAQVLKDKQTEWSKAWYTNTINSTDQTVSNVMEVGDYQTPQEYLYYANPTKTHEALKVYTYVVILADFKGTDYYYAVPLYNSDKKEGEEDYLDIEPNHWYDMTIKKVVKEGNASPDDAIKFHNDNQIWVDIHDHAPEVLSMVTDGIHELGVTRDLVVKKDQNNNSVEMTVKCYAADQDKIDLSNIEFEHENWISIALKGNESDYNYQSTGGTSADIDHPGILLTYIVTVDTQREVFSEETSVIKVKWRGLEREVTLTYDPGFSVAEVCTATLNIVDKDNNETYVIKDYWNFVTGKGTAKTREGLNFGVANTPKLWGITYDVLTGEKKRTNGFHFPMPYGKKITSDPWQYVYDLDFSTGITELQGKITDVKAEFSSTMASNVKWAKEAGYNYKGKLTWIGDATSFTYDGGTVKFTITYNDNTPATEVTLSLYHTGFFHYDGNADYLRPEDLGYYYYEVVPMGDSYWLDRNIGAKSNMMFVDDEAGGLGNSLARGIYYKVASYNAFSDPKIEPVMCPPGYHIPARSEWNTIRLSSNFMSGDETYGDQHYISSYYNTGNSKIGRVYFPRVRYRNDINDNSKKFELSPNMGDASTGYYWTVTPAPGEEKYEMGNWLRSLYLNGVSTTYLNVNVTESKMNVRCVADVSVPELEDNYISFNVHNATHVYLFDKVNKKALYTFPGKPVGTSDSSQKWQYFSCTTSYPLDDILALFVKVDSNGKVILYTRSGNKFSTDVEFSQNILTDRYAWPLHRGYYYDFCATANSRNDPSVTLEKPDECDVDESTNSGGPQEEPDDWEAKDPEVELYKGPKTMRDWTDNDNCQNLANTGWLDKVEPISYLRIYVKPTNDGEELVKIQNGNWSDIPGVPADNKWPQNNVIEIKLTSSIIQHLKANNGIVIYGTHYVLRGVAIVYADQTGEVEEEIKFEKEYDDEIVLWSGDFSMSGYNEPRLVIPASQFSGKTGNVLKIYVAPSSTVDGLEVFYGNWGNEGVLERFSSAKNNICEMSLTPEILGQFQQRGVLFQAGNARIIGVTLY